MDTMNEVFSFEEMLTQDPDAYSDLHSALDCLEEKLGDYQDPVDSQTGDNMGMISNEPFQDQAHERTKSGPISIVVTNSHHDEEEQDSNPTPANSFVNQNYFQDQPSLNFSAVHLRKLEQHRQEGLESEPISPINSNNNNNNINNNNIIISNSLTPSAGFLTVPNTQSRRRPSLDSLNLGLTALDVGDTESVVSDCSDFSDFTEYDLSQDNFIIDQHDVIRIPSPMIRMIPSPMPSPVMPPMSSSFDSNTVGDGTNSNWNLLGQQTLTGPLVPPQVFIQGSDEQTQIQDAEQLQQSSKSYEELMSEWEVLARAQLEQEQLLQQQQQQDQLLQQQQQQDQLQTQPSQFLSKSNIDSAYHSRSQSVANMFAIPNSDNMIPSVTVDTTSFFIPSNTNTSLQPPPSPLMTHAGTPTNAISKSPTISPTPLDFSNITSENVMDYTVAHKNGRTTLYQCPLCLRAFSRPYALKSHFRSHSGERPFICSYEGCGQSFSRKHDWRRHEALHGGARPYVCKVCNKGFARSDALTRHLKTADPNIPSPCGFKLLELQPTLTKLNAQSANLNANMHRRGKKKFEAEAEFESTGADSGHVDLGEPQMTVDSTSPAFYVKTETLEDVLTPAMTSDPEPEFDIEFEGQHGDFGQEQLEDEMTHVQEFLDV